VRVSSVAVVFGAGASSDPVAVEPYSVAAGAESSSSAGGHERNSSKASGNFNHVGVFRSRTIFTKWSASVTLVKTSANHSPWLSSSDRIKGFLNLNSLLDVSELVS
jgi:hypothetical protein